MASGHYELCTGVGTVVSPWLQRVRQRNRTPSLGVDVDHSDAFVGPGSQELPVACSRNNIHITQLSRRGKVDGVAAAESLRRSHVGRGKHETSVKFETSTMPHNPSRSLRLAANCVAVARPERSAIASAAAASTYVNRASCRCQLAPKRPAQDRRPAGPCGGR